MFYVITTFKAEAPNVCGFNLLLEAIDYAKVSRAEENVLNVIITQAIDIQ